MNKPLIGTISGWRDRAVLTSCNSSWAVCSTPYHSSQYQSWRQKSGAKASLLSFALQTWTLGPSRISWPMQNLILHLMRLRRASTSILCAFWCASCWDGTRCYKLPGILGSSWLKNFPPCKIRKMPKLQNRLQSKITEDSVKRRETDTGQLGQYGV